MGDSVYRVKLSRRSGRRRRLRELLILTSGFFISFFVFSITFYQNSDYLLDFIYYITSPSPISSENRISSLKAIENYRPRDFPGKKQAVNVAYYIKYDDFDYLTPDSLTFKNRVYLKNIELLIRFPKKQSTIALLLIFHSCRYTALDWFHTAERQRIIGTAVDQGFGCLVFQASNDETRCWANNADIYDNRDVQMVISGLDGFYKEYPKLDSLPRFTFGSSSGGIFSSIFAVNHRYPIQGQILFTSIILPEVLYVYVKSNNYPPTAWIHMLRDNEFASEERINISKAVFVAQNISHIGFPIEPISLSHRTFRDRLPTVNDETSRFLFYRLQQNGWLNSYNILKHNPRRKFAWKTFLFPENSDDIKNERIYNNIMFNREIISEFLNTIYGEHAISYERSSEALRWLKESCLSSPISDESRK